MTRISNISMMIGLLLTCQIANAAADSECLSVPLTIHWPADTLRYDFPVRNGIPLPQGAVLDVKQLSLLDRDGKKAPFFQSIPLGYWPDGSIKWALADFQARAEDHGDLQLAAGEAERQEDQSPLRVQETSEQIEVVTGPLRFTVLKSGGGWLREVWLDQNGDQKFSDVERVVKPGSDAFIELGYRLPKDRTKAKRQPKFEISEDQAKAMTGIYHAVGAADSQAEIQEAGPSRVIIRCTGTHIRDDGAAYAPYSIWINAFAGQPYLQITHTFTGNVDIRMNDTLDVGISLCYDLNQPQFAFGTDRHSLQGLVGQTQTWLIYQNADPKRWPKFNHYQPEYEIRQEATCLDKGTVPPGWMNVSDGRMSIGLIAKDLKEMYPKELLIDGIKGQLVYGINPPHGGPYDWYNGVNPEEISPTGGEWDNPGTDAISRTHDLMIVFYPGDSNAAYMSNLTRLLNDPPLAQSSPEWLGKTQAIGPVIAQNTKDFPDAERWFSQQAEWMYRHMNDWFKWWGDVDYGGLQCYYLPEDGHWCNLLERFGWIGSGYETQIAPWMYYMRTGDRRFFRMAQACARHTADLEIGANGKGRRMFAIDFGRMGDADHNDPGGIIWAWYHTGDYRLKEIALKSTRWCYTGKDSGARGEAVWRNLCLRIRNGVRSFEMTGDSQYREKVQENLKILLSYQEPDGRFREYQQSFILPNYGVPALIEGYELTKDEEVKDALIRYARWASSGRGQDDNQWASRAHRRLTLALNGWAYQYTGDNRFLWAIVSDLNGRGYIAERLRFTPKLRNPGTNIDYRFRDYSQPVYPEMFAQMYVEAKIMVRLPYALAALQKGGLPQRSYQQMVDTDPVGYAAPERGRRNLRKNANSRVEFVCLKQAVNANPYTMDNYGWGPVEHHWTKQSVETVLEGLPFGAVVEYLGVPFRMLDPDSNNGKAILVLQDRQRVRFDVPQQAARLHFLGHICGHGDTDLGKAGAAYTFHFTDGTSENVPLQNCVDYEDVRMWHLSKNAPLARSWWTRYDYSKIRHMNVWSYSPPKPIRYVELEDMGEKHQFTLLAVSAEMDERDADPEVLAQLTDSQTIQGEKAISFSALQTPCELELCLSSVWPVLMNVYAGDTLLLKNYYVAGTFYGYDNRETLRIPLSSKNPEWRIKLIPESDSLSLPELAQWQYDPQADEAADEPPWRPHDQRNTWTLHGACLLKRSQMQK